MIKVGLAMRHGVLPASLHFTMPYPGLEIEGSPYEFFLRRAKVALSDGPNFGTPGRGFARINFATSRAIVAEALDRMAEALS